MWFDLKFNHNTHVPKRPTAPYRTCALVSCHARELPVAPRSPVQPAAAALQACWPADEACAAPLVPLASQILAPATAHECWRGSSQLLLQPPGVCCLRTAAGSSRAAGRVLQKWHAAQGQAVQGLVGWWLCQGVHQREEENREVAG